MLMLNILLMILLMFTRPELSHKSQFFLSIDSTILVMAKYGPIEHQYFGSYHYQNIFKVQTYQSGNMMCIRSSKLIFDNNYKKNKKFYLFEDFPNFSKLSYCKYKQSKIKTKLLWSLIIIIIACF
jgi:hypothetical protein